MCQFPGTIALEIETWQEMGKVGLCLLLAAQLQVLLTSIVHLPSGLFVHKDIYFRTTFQLRFFRFLKFLSTYFERGSKQTQVSMRKFIGLYDRDNWLDRYKMHRAGQKLSSMSWSYSLHVEFLLLQGSLSSTRKAFQ